MRQFSFAEARDSQLVFVNGIFQPELSSVSALPAGVVVSNLADALERPEYEPLLIPDFARPGNGFSALNTALFAGGAFVFAPNRGCGRQVSDHD